MSAVLVDSNILLDVLSEDPRWCAWSSQALRLASSRSRLVINAVIYAEVSIDFRSMEDLDMVLSERVWHREPIPFDAAFLAGKAFNAYRRRGGLKRSPLPGFLIGAHAAAANYMLLTRDATRYRSYFPTVKLIAPE